jgi:hypothetical protein
MPPIPASPLPENSAAAWSGREGPWGHETGTVYGGVRLAVAQRPGAVAVSAGFTLQAARARADMLAGAIDALHKLPDSEPADVIELRLVDFMPDPPVAGTARVAGVGMLSGQRYLLPAEVVRLADPAGRVQPTMIGVVGASPYGATAAVADVLAHDVFARWWRQPDTRLLRVSAHLPELLPPQVAGSISALGQWVSAFVLPGPDFRLAVVGLGGTGATIATAGARSVRAAVGEAFLRAVAARAQPWSSLPTADSLRRLTVWHRKADYLTHLERDAVDAHPAEIDEFAATVTGGREPVGWADIAVRRFGHEPVLVVTGDGREPVKVVCPGAACYHPAPPGPALPCPVP